MKIQLTDLAYQDIADIKDYIKKDSAYYANHFIERIISAMEKLKEFQNIVVLYRK